MNGEEWVLLRAEDGYIMVFISKFFLFNTGRAEPHILLFKRPLGTDPKTGNVSEEIKNQHNQKSEELR